MYKWKEAQDKVGKNPWTQDTAILRRMPAVCWIYQTYSQQKVNLYII